MIIDNVNLNLLRVFECVYRLKSMTRAAKELHMTQSGVSQNIKNLEDILEVKLFDRIKQRPVPTYKANFLFKACSKNLYDIDRTLIEIKGGEGQFAGTISIGTPVEFGNNIILPLLAQLSETFPHLSFKIKYGHAAEMNNGLLSGELDFAFVDTYGLDPRITSQKVHDEILVLCASEKYYKSLKKIKSHKRFFESMRYIDYVEDAPLVKMWFKHHYKVHNFSIHVRSSLMNDQGVTRMVTLGLGAGVLPSHVVRRQIQRGDKLHQFTGRETPLMNSISIAYVPGRSSNPAVNIAYSSLIESLQKFNHDK